MGKILVSKGKVIIQNNESIFHFNFQPLYMRYFSYFNQFFYSLYKNQIDRKTLDILILQA